MVRNVTIYEAATHGEGFEGFVNWANIATGHLLLPLFLIIMYALTLYAFSKSNYKMGGIIAYVSLAFFILSWIAQSFTSFNQLFVFIFALGIIFGIVKAGIDG